jgi:O-acetyl-ADP-ribose deacetylase (regulator of RNase III)
MEAFNSKIDIVFVDQNPEVVFAYAKWFGKYLNCRIIQGNVFDHGPGVIAVPVNRHGDLTCGLGLQIAQRFIAKMGIATRLQRYIAMEHGGQLQLGRVQIIPTYDEEFPLVIFISVTDRDFMLPDTAGIGRAAVAMFEEIGRFREKRKELYDIHRLIIPGFGTGSLGLAPEESAKSIYQACRKGKYKFLQV